MSTLEKTARPSRNQYQSTGLEQATTTKIVPFDLPKPFRRIIERSRYKAFYGGRGSAKSHTIATVLVLMASERCLRILCCREIQKSIATSSKQLIQDKIRALGLEAFFNIKLTEITGLNGSQFIFTGLRSNPESVKSMEGVDIAWVEEARSVSRESLELLIPTIRKEVRGDDGRPIWKSEIWFSWNPGFITDPVDAMFRGEHGPPPDTICFNVNYFDNPWFPQVLRDEMEYDKRRDPDKYAHVWLGQYQRNSEARVFRNWRIEEFETPKDARFYFGADWGFAVDPTVLVRCFIAERTIYVDYEAYKVGCEIDNTPALFDTIGNGMAREWVIRADSSRPETISYMQRHGYSRIAPAIKGPASVKDGIEFLKSYDIVVHPRCTHVADELSLYSFKTDPHTQEILPVLDDKKNHVIDALRYALEGLRHQTFVSIKPMRLW